METSEDEAFSSDSGSENEVTSASSRFSVTSIEEESTSESNSDDSIEREYIPASTLSLNERTHLTRQQRYAARERLVRQRETEVDHTRTVRPRLDEAPKGLYNFARQYDFDSFDENELMKTSLEGKPTLHDVHSSYCGPMDMVCSFCKARYFRKEVDETGKYTKCCGGGKVQLPPIPIPTPLVAACLDKQTPIGRLFHKKSTLFNSQLSLSSINFTLDRAAGFSAVTMHGKIYSKLGPVHSDEPAFMSHYFYENGLNVDSCKLSNSEKALLMRLREEMLEWNPLLESIKSHEVMYGDYAKLPLFRLEFSDTPPPNKHQGIYSVPRVEIPEAGIILTYDEGQPAHRRVNIAFNDGTLQSIKSNNAFYDTLGYCLFHMHGDTGWHRDLLNIKGGKLTSLKYYCYRVHVRDAFNRDPLEMSDVVLNAGRLTLQYVCDMATKVEEENLNFLKSASGQKAIRAELYQGLSDAVEYDEQASVGKKVILPATHAGSPRQFMRSYQDAMAMVRTLGKPVYFITFTCNQHWKEIVENLQPGQESWERADLEVRVFNMKLKMLLEDLNKHNILGRVKGHIHVIEFQKRGLPHAHILLIIDEADKPRQAHEFDKVAFAEIPDKERNPKLFKTITTSMVHRQCGDHNKEAPCMKDGVCSKDFPKDFHDETVLDENEYYPKYRRRSPSMGGNTFDYKGSLIDNSWVVPYNPYLCLKYDAHINVEICASLLAVKYLYKYVYKGPDRIAYAVVSEENNRNEIMKYMDGRCITSCEAFWQLFSFKMSTNNPVVKRLPVHTEKNQRVCYTEGNEIAALNRNEITMLTAFFDNNKKESLIPIPVKKRTDKNGVVHPPASELLYHEYPAHFVFIDGNKGGVGRGWRRRIRVTKEDSIGRIFFIPRSEGETYYLRMLLHHVRGPTSWDDLKLVHEIQHTTYKSACCALGLLSDDSEWISLFTEMSVSYSPFNLREAFISILLYETPEEPNKLWHQFKDEFSYDYTKTRNRRERLNKSAVNVLCIDEDHNESLYYIESMLGRATNGVKNNSTYGLPPVDYSLSLFQDGEGEISEPIFDPVAAALEVKNNYLLFNKEQRSFYKAILRSIRRKRSKLYFLDGPGGTGKTFVFNTILLQMKIEGIPAVVTATSGIASTLFVDGRTNHNAYAVPFQCFEDSSCSLTIKSIQGQRIRDAQLLIIDEAPMANKNVLHAIDRLLKELCNNTLWMGGKTVILGGDWRQVLPVVQRGSRGKILQQLLLRSPMWSSVKIHRLVVNERVKRGGGDAEYAQAVLDVGSGTAETFDRLLNTNPSLPEKMIKIPERIVFPSQDATDLLKWVFPRLHLDSYHSSDACILTPKNVTVDELNELAVNMKPGQLHHKLSADETTDEHSFITTELMNTLTPSGMPPHDLALKVGAPVILLRNLNPVRGLCNGTRMIVRKICDNFLECEIRGGSHSGEIVIIHRITLKSEGDLNLGFTMSRRQFPVRLNYAMSINKSQGQTLNKVAIYLPEPCFAHGQLYVALSRCGNADNIRVLVKDIPNIQGRFEGLCGTFTRNIVYYEVLAH